MVVCYHDLNYYIKSQSVNYVLFCWTFSCCSLCCKCSRSRYMTCSGNTLITFCMTPSYGIKFRYYIRSLKYITCSIYEFPAKIVVSAGLAITK